MVKTRLFRPGDLPFVETMLVAACFPPTQALTVAEARKFPHAVRWLEPGVGVFFDVAVLVEDESGPVGAAVGRRFANADPSWGVLSADVPELAMAVAREHRGRVSGIRSFERGSRSSAGAASPRPR